VRLQPRLVLTTARTLGRYRRVGDPAADLNAAGQGLLNALQANGCSTSPQASVSAFQTAYNALPPITNSSGTPGIVTSLTVDGKYGPATQAALQAWADSQNLSVTVPANCFPTGSSSGGSSSTSTTTTTTTNNATVLPQPLMASLMSSWMGAPAWLWVLGGAVMVGVFYETRDRKAPAMFSTKPKRRRRARRLRRRHGRRRNPGGLWNGPGTSQYGWGVFHKYRGTVEKRPFLVFPTKARANSELKRLHHIWGNEKQFAVRRA
jgi:hypothetical protein